jgi:hypothetical protein
MSLPEDGEGPTSDIAGSQTKKRQKTKERKKTKDRKKKFAA